MNNFIRVYNNVVSDEFCKETIIFFDDVEKKGLCKSRQDHDGAEKIHKQDQAFFLPPPLNTEYDMIHLPQSYYDEFNKALWDVGYKQYAEEFSILNSAEQHKSYIKKLQKTRPGEGYHVWHFESSNREMSKRLLTWTLYLNDEFEAGETEFLYQQYRYKPKKGDLIIFPASFTHTHRGNPPINGTKYIATGWIEF